MVVNCKVNFYVDGELYDTSTVMVGQTVSSPINPKKENYIFTGWRTDGEISFAYDFSTKVIFDMNLHATFAPDAVKIGNMINEKTLKSTVKVLGKSYNTMMGGLVATEASISQGSGAVIDISGGYAYVLTNRHVVTKLEGYDKHSISVEDPWGNTYDAKIYKNVEYAISEAYDLALICFEYAPEHKDRSLIEFELGKDAKVGDCVISIGNPRGLINSVTYGYALAYQKIEADEESAISNVKFDVLVHDGPITHGSSGGALVDACGRLVGLNFAVLGGGAYGCSIPISRIEEFLSIYVYRNN
jgi:S1-C subfamily serine protease